MRISARSFCHAFIVWLAVVSPAAAVQSACSDDPSWQAPHDEGQVFYLQKSSNPNTVVYAMQFDDEGKLKRQKPMTAYWRRFAEHGQRMELRFLERILAFDIQYSVIDAAEPAYRAILPIGGQPALLDCIYIELRETDFIPKILHVDLVGRAVNGSEPVRQRLLPP